MKAISKKQKFYKPAVNIKKSRKLYEKASETYNSRFYKNGKVIWEGSRMLKISHKEIFIALLVIMNDRLKVRNFSTGNNPEHHNYYRNPFVFYVNTNDIINVLSQGQTQKTEISKATIKRALYRLADENVGYILQLNWKRSKYRYETVLNPLLIEFQETFINKTTSCKSVILKSKNPNCHIITPIYSTSINNKKTNLSDFQNSSNLQANLNLKKLNIKKNKPADETMIDKIIGKTDKITDNRKLSEKKQQKKEISGEILNDLKKIGYDDTIEKAKKIINKMLLPAKKTKSFSSQSQRKINDFLLFKKQIIINFYVYFLSIFFDPEKAKKYNPNDTDSPFFIYTLQAIQELAENPVYFGNCKTIYDYEKRFKFLKYVVFNTKKGWMNKRKNFNTDFIHPNRFLSGNHDKFKFRASVTFYENKLKSKGENYKPAEKEITDKQFISSLTILAKILNKQDFIPTDPEFKKHIKIYIDNNNNINCRAKKTYKTFLFIQNYIKYTFK